MGRYAFLSFRSFVLFSFHFLKFGRAHTANPSLDVLYILRIMNIKKFLTSASLSTKLEAYGATFSVVSWPSLLLLSSFSDVVVVVSVVVAASVSVIFCNVVVGAVLVVVKFNGRVLVAVLLVQKRFFEGASSSIILLICESSNFSLSKLIFSSFSFNFWTGLESIEKSLLERGNKRR